MKKMKRLRINKTSKEVTKVKRESQAVSPVPLSLNPILCRSAVESRSGGRQKIIRSEDVICYRWTGTLPTLALPLQPRWDASPVRILAPPTKHCQMATMHRHREKYFSTLQLSSTVCRAGWPVSVSVAAAQYSPALTWPLDIPSSGIIMITEPVSSCGGQHPGLAAPAATRDHRTLEKR